MRLFDGRCHCLLAVFGILSWLPLNEVSCRESTQGGICGARRLIWAIRASSCSSGEPAESTVAVAKPSERVEVELHAATPGLGSSDFGVASVASAPLEGSHHGRARLRRPQQRKRQPMSGFRQWGLQGTAVGRSQERRRHRDGTGTGSDSGGLRLDAMRSFWGRVYRTSPLSIVGPLSSRGTRDV
jgi:hypothetical protein